MTEIIRISKEVHKKIKIVCAYKGLKIKEYVEQTLERELQKDLSDLNGNNQG